MKDRNEFVLAVIVALSVPLIFGGIYFYHMSMNRGSNNTLAKLEDKRELFIFGDKLLEEISSNIYEDKDYEGAASIDFEVDYASGKDEVTSYDIVLRDLSIAKEADARDIHWSLKRKDEESGEFRTIAMGNFDTQDGIVKMVKKEELSLTHSKQYKLYYYLNREVKDSKLFARVSIE